MNGSLPTDPADLRRQLIRRLGIAGVVIGLAAAGIAYWIETRRIEETAFSIASENARHFDSPSMRALLRTEGAVAHPGMQRFLDSSRFVGIRILDRAGSVLLESWKPGLSDLRSDIGIHRHALPAKGAQHHNWLRTNGGAFIQVVLPLLDDAGTLDMYFEGVYQLDAEVHRAQQERIIDSGITALVSTLLATALLYPVMLGLARRSWSLSRSLLESNLDLMETLGSAIAKRDSDTDAHNYRVTLYAVRLAETMDRPKGEIRDLIAGAFLHDIGKIGIPDRILLKPGPLTAEELPVMKTHVALGEDIVAGNRWLERARCVIRHHHERYDGGGYPDGLYGDAIPFNARLFAVVDVFDALMSKRPYKVAFALDRALDEIAQDAGRHFDPQIAAAFLDVADRLFAAIAKSPPDVLREQMRQVLVGYFATASEHA